MRLVLCFETSQFSNHHTSATATTLSSRLHLNLTMKLSAALLALSVSPVAGFSPLIGPTSGSSAHGKLALSSSDKYMESLAKTGGGLPGSAEEASRVVRSY